MMNEWGKRARLAFPAGSNGEFNLPAELTTVIARGEGCHLWTADHRQMLDFSMGWGSVLVGHADPRIMGPVGKRLWSGSNFATITEASLELAEALIEISPACEQIRFCASGTEATMMCLRLARAATGRTHVLRFEGAYHGSHDVGVTGLFPTGHREFPAAEPSSDGLMPDSSGHILVAPFNDPERTTQIIQENASRLAAVIVEPLQRCLRPEPGFLERVRQVTLDLQIPLVFDEVVTGFRLALGGAQEHYGVIPDLVAYGKALGGGLPIGAFGGRHALMQLMSEDRHGHTPPQTYVWSASSLGGNPISCTAALSTLGVLREPDSYTRLHSLGEYLRDGMRSLLSAFPIDAQVLGDGPLAQIAFTANRARDYRSSQHDDKSFARELMLDLFRRGIFLNPMGTKLYLSLAHDQAACNRFLNELDAALRRLIKAVPVSTGALT